MRIIVNNSTLRFGGAVQGAVSFIRECKNFPNNVYYIFLGPGPAKSINPEDYPSNFHFRFYDFGPINLLNTRKVSKTLSTEIDTIKPDCIITNSGPAYCKTKYPHLIGFNLGNYIYSESPYFNTISYYRKIRHIIRKQIHRYFFKRDGSAYYVQTNDVNKRVRKYLKTKNVFTVSNTYNDYFIHKKKYPNKLPTNAKKNNRFLTLSAYYYHKNLEIIPQIIDELKKRGRSDFQFILTIDQDNYYNLFKNAYESEAINVEQIAPSEAPSLYNECDFMFLPTLIECFSASYPEAMIMQKPILTTNLSFAKNICGDAALFYKAMDANDAADAIIKLIDSSELQNRLINNGIKQVGNFDNAKTRAKKILAICEKIINEK